ncbi:MAG: RIO1 family regulatory kinase/ATPase [Sulfolobales archaeon]|nr:RIO1 family regulatory kinase/ATPase [Sulfolobales archaeon]
MKLARVCKHVSEEGLSILTLLDRYTGMYEYVPEDLLLRKAQLYEKALAREIETLKKLKLVEVHPTRAAYRITFLGLDCLALLDLVKRDVLSHMGPPIGTGKESVLYLAKTPLGSVVTVKFYKIGRVSFKKVVRTRDYLVDQSSWLEASKTSAEREYRALSVLSKQTGLVPKVFGWSRHAVVMEYVEGVDLCDYRSAEDPEGILKRILLTLRVAYLGAGIVHADLSEYNVVISIRDSTETPYIIDWPQYLSREDPRAGERLKIDVATLLKFFKRRYGVLLDLESAVKYVKGLLDGI